MAQANENVNTPHKIINKGTGAGGSNTNKNGIPYEEITDLDDRLIIIEKNNFSSKIRFMNNEKTFIKTKQSNLFKCMKDDINQEIEKAHGCKNPDECYIDKELKNMFIIENFNNVLVQYVRKYKHLISNCGNIQNFQKYNIIYIYCLSDWFKKLYS